MSMMRPAPPGAIYDLLNDEWTLPDGGKASGIEFVKSEPATAAEAFDQVVSTSDARIVNNTMRHAYRILSDEEKALMQRIKDDGLAFHDLIASLGGKPRAFDCQDQGRGSCAVGRKALDGMSDFLTRLNDEHAELHERVNKLTAFIGTASFDALPDRQRELLSAQLAFMLDYLNIVSQRLIDLGVDL